MANHIPFPKALLFYNTLGKNSLPDSDGTLVYRGYIIRIYDEAGLSYGYYNPIVRGLVELGCIEVIQRGNANNQAIIRALRPPEEDEWQEIRLKALTPSEQSAKVVEDVQKLNRLVGEVSVPDGLLHLSQRLDRLERGLRELNGKT